MRVPGELSDGECHELCVSGLAHGGFRYSHALKRASNIPAAFLKGSDRQVDQLGCSVFVRERSPRLDRFANSTVQAFNCVGNRYEEFGVEVRPGFSDLGVWCDHPGQRHRERESAGRPIYTMSRELELVVGRLCDSPGCAESANP